MAENESLVMDDAFEQYVKQAELEAKINSRGNSSFKKEYEEIKYAGLTVGVPLIVRAVDGPPNSDLTPYTARKVTIARIVDGNRSIAIAKIIGITPPGLSLNGINEFIPP